MFCALSSEMHQISSRAAGRRVLTDRELRRRRRRRSNYREVDAGVNNSCALCDFYLYALAFFCVRVPLTETDASFSKQHPFKWFSFQWPRRTAQRLAAFRNCTQMISILKARPK
jgi:hypothetical protein